MTVSSTVPWVQLNCNGSLTEFDFDFSIANTSDLKVILTDSNGIETELSETTHYSVSATNNDYSNGGTITTVQTYSSEYKITIMREVSLTQESNFTEGQATLYESFEDGLDKSVRIDQDMASAISRALRLQDSISSLVSGLVPNPSANAYLAWNSGGTGLENKIQVPVSPGAIALLSDYDDNLETAVSTISTTPKHLIVNVQPDALTGDLTIPKTLTLEWQHSCILNRGGHDLEINSALIAGRYQLFSGSGTVTGDALIEAVIPEWFGAVGDGSTNDSVAIQEAIDFCYDMGGGIVLFLAKIYGIGATLVLKHNVILWGKGIEKTFLKALSALNSAVVRSYNYSTFLGQNKNNISDGVPHNIGFVGMTIDGNKANQSSSNATGVELYAGNLIIQDLYIRDCYGDGWVSEKGVGTTPDGSTQLYEGRVDGLWIGYNGGRGMYFKGPNDTRINQLIVFENTGDGVEFEDSAGVYSASHHVEHLHAYANGGYGVKTNRALRINDLEASNNGKAGLKITAGYFHTVDFANIYRNCETSGSFQAEVDATTGYSHFNFLFKDNEYYRAGVGDLDFNAFNSYLNVISKADSGSTGTGVRIGSNASKLTADLNIKGYNGSGGIGLETGYGGAVTNARIYATIIDCKTGWIRTNPSNISNFDMNIEAMAGQTIWSGEAFDPSSAETARIASYDTDTTKNWIEVYGMILGGVSFFGAQTAHHQKTTELTLSGSTTNWTGAIPAGTIVLGVTARVTVLVEGANEMDIGENGGDTDLFIDGMDVALNTTADLSDSNAAFTGPKIYATATDILVSAIGGAGSFSAGKLRLTLHYIDLDYPTN